MTPFFRFVKVAEPKRDLKNHNVLKDPNLERWGIKDFVLRAYQGETVHVYDIRVPIQEVVALFGGNKELVSESLYHNMNAFPIYNENNELTYIVTIFITSRSYDDREEIMKGKGYIDEHWQEDFDMNKLAGIVHMSKYHYTRLFKLHTGMTPYNY
ncbi:MAG: AraC family transcriptional regulator [Desulfitobacteriaceae bacterium]|nr:AraC family transcriptional regulator [Desulfitobacteriaceae bacterium]